MPKRGRPTKKQKTTKTDTQLDTSQKKIPAEWTTPKVEMSRENLPSSHDVVVPSKRKFTTDQVILLKVPSEFEFLSQVPLYTPRPAEGKIPLEEWSTKELQNFRDELAALGRRLRETNDYLQAEATYIAECRDKQTFPIPIVLEDIYLRNKGDATGTTRGPEHRANVGLGGLSKMEISSQEMTPIPSTTPRKEPKRIIRVSVGGLDDPMETDDDNSNLPATAPPTPDIEPVTPTPVEPTPLTPSQPTPPKPSALNTSTPSQPEHHERPTPVTPIPRKMEVRKEPRPSHSNPLPTPVDFHPEVVEDLVSDEESPGLKKSRRGQRKKRKGVTDSKQKRKRKRRKRSGESSEEDGDEEEIVSKPTANNSAPLLASANFWASMEPYVAPFNAVDLHYLKPIEYPAEGHTTIPPLGKHYSHTDSSMEPVPEKEPEEEEKNENKVSCRDLTQRVLASLLEVENNGDDPMIDTSEISRTSLPLEVPPTSDYSTVRMDSLEERVRMELMCIGLLDEDMNLARREDDEICSEIRLLQQQLRDRIKSNNERRLALYNKALQSIKDNRPTIKKFAEFRCVEQIYDRKRTKPKGRRRNKGGRPRGRPPSTPSTPLPSTPKSQPPTTPGFPAPPTKAPRQFPETNAHDPSAMEI